MTPDQTRLLHELQARCRSTIEGNAMIDALQAEINGVQEDIEEDQARGQPTHEVRRYVTWLREIIVAWLDQKRPSGRGRPMGTGYFGSREECRAAILDSMVALRARNQPISQDRVAAQFRFTTSKQQIVRWMHTYRLNWHVLKREVEAMPIELLSINVTAGGLYRGERGGRHHGTSQVGS
jgi:hypothetical protein